MPDPSPPTARSGVITRLRAALTRLKNRNGETPRVLGGGQAARRKAWLSPGTASAALLVGLAIIGVLIYVQGKALVERSVRQRLEEIASLKESLVQAWIEDTRHDIRVWADSWEFIEALDARKTGRSLSAETTKDMQDDLWRLTRTSHYVAVAVRDPVTGERWFGTVVGADSDQARQRARELAATTVDAAWPLLADVIGPLGMTRQIVLFDLVTPVAGPAGRAVIEVDIDPGQDLFRIVRPGVSRRDSAEVLLVRREGSSVIVLNDSLAHSPGQQTRLVNDGSEGSMWAAFDRQGVGFVRGMDDDGEAVLALAVPVRGTPWLLVAKLDQAEAFAELHRIMGLSLTMAGVLLALFAWWSMERQKYVATQSRLERERIEHAEHVAELSRRVVLTQEEERHRMARELHDRTSANLAAMQLNLKSVARTVPASEPEDQELLHETGHLLADTIVSIREFCAELRPALLDYAGLLQAIRSLAAQVERRTGIQAEVDDRGWSGTLSPTVEADVFRIVQEALLNCTKHSQAQHARIVLAQRDGRFSVDVADDGQGFDPASLGQGGRRVGQGLLNMRDRAALAGGTLTIESAVGAGTRIRFALDDASAAA